MIILYYIILLKKILAIFNSVCHKMLTFPPGELRAGSLHLNWKQYPNSENRFHLHWIQYPNNGYISIYPKWINVRSDNVVRTRWMNRYPLGLTYKLPGDVFLGHSGVTDDVAGNGVSVVSDLWFRHFRAFQLRRELETHENVASQRHRVPANDQIHPKLGSLKIIRDKRTEGIDRSI